MSHFSRSSLGGNWDLLERVAWGPAPTHNMAVLSVLAEATLETQRFGLCFAAGARRDQNVATGSSHRAGSRGVPGATQGVKA